MINILRAIFADLNRNPFIFKDNIFYLPHIFISYVDMVALSMLRSFH